MNNKAYQIGFFTLLAVNLVWVILFSFRPKPHARQSDIKDNIGQELDFNPDQKAAFDKMAMQHQQTIRKIDKEEQELVSTFFDQLLPDADQTDHDQILSQILQLEKDKIMVTYHHFEDLKDLCNEEQVKKFDQVLQHILPRLTRSSGQQGKPERPPFGPKH
ncbi:hypothetical protein KO507_18500 [Gilvimarinus agarilyticus]|uniref:hypothetical protein n=1 Tax=Reichenbachiella TaxID=156993 RepID=UPI000E6C2B19|nr:MULTISPECIES: hypothetical protein [Reichenbachiella]MBU2887761.1 hypothetical protein [Gilvimarinus agarilyticus]MBU2914090.1 hypothetical protein [Reichenbachiella agariperforans]RJE74007.1 hypothetical protein BGP76_12460 [Reichenbachiella sp. MSK19-1]